MQTKNKSRAIKRVTWSDEWQESESDSQLSTKSEKFAHERKESDTFYAVFMLYKLSVIDEADEGKQ
mgnify:CR=1 FL=1